MEFNRIKAAEVLTHCAYFFFDGMRSETALKIEKGFNIIGNIPVLAVFSGLTRALIGLAEVIIGVVSLIFGLIAHELNPKAENGREQVENVFLIASGLIDIGRGLFQEALLTGVLGIGVISGIYLNTRILNNRQTSNRIYGYGAPIFNNDNYYKSK